MLNEINAFNGFCPAIIAGKVSGEKGQMVQIGG